GCVAVVLPHVARGSTQPAAHDTTTTTRLPDGAYVAVVHGSWGTVYQHTFTKPAEVHTRSIVLNEPRSVHPRGGTNPQIPFYDFDAGYYPPPYDDPRYRFAVVFTAQEERVEIVEVQQRCDATRVLRGWPPTFTLQVEGGPSGSLPAFYKMTYYPSFSSQEGQA